MCWEEEKKESGPEQRHSCSGGGGLTRLTVRESEIAGLAGIPEEIKYNQYATEHDLLIIDLEKLLEILETLRVRFDPGLGYEM